MDYEKRLSIIVPIYNVEKYLERCVNSLLKQDIDKRDYEIILVNDGSTDNGYEVASRLTNENTNIKLFSKPNGGLSSTRNFGIERASGRYIMHVDSDDFLEENVLGKVLRTAEDENLDLCFFYARFFPDQGNLLNVQPFQLYRIYNGEYVLLNGMKVSSSWSNLYSHDFLTQVGIEFYGNISHQDVEYNLRLYPFAKRIMFTDFVVYNYFIEEESISRTKDIKKIECGILDNLIVARNIKSFAVSSTISVDLKKMLERRMNSIVFSSLFSLLTKCDNWSRDFLQRYIDEAKMLGLYPIMGMTESWKTTLLAKMLNIDFFLRVVMKCK